MTSNEGMTQAEYDADFPRRAQAINATIRSEIDRVTRRESAERLSLLGSLVEDWHFNGGLHEETEDAAYARLSDYLAKLGPDNIAWIIRSEDPITAFYDSI